MFGVGLVKGLGVTITHFIATYVDDLRHWIRLQRYHYPDRIHRRPKPDQKGIFTIQYPEERMEMFPRFRGCLMQMRNPETGEPNCTACGVCVRACPHGSIKMVASKGPDRKLVLESFEVHLENCMVCGLCVEACRFDALGMSPEYENATYQSEDLVYDMDKLLSIGDKYATWQKRKEGGEGL
jgi:NADH-quinone oxidoreductase subunit I